jgi:hypothetical protein
VSDRSDGDADSLPPDEVDDTPTLSCSRCDREWALDYELDTLQAGNQAVEQFALELYRFRVMAHAQNQQAFPQHTPTDWDRQ